MTFDSDCVDVDLNSRKFFAILLIYQARQTVLLFACSSNVNIPNTVQI
jgi:hypothetical protein